MTRNIELLTKVRDLVAADPTKLDMGIWALVPYDLVQLNDGGMAKVTCGTTACIAGWAVQLGGSKLLVTEQDLRDGVYSAGSCVAGNGRVVDIENHARKLLGLTQDEADYLFFVDDDQVIPLLTRLIKGEDILPDYWFDD